MATMATKIPTKNPTQTPTHIKITKNDAWIKHDNGIEIRVSKTWLREYVEYTLITRKEVVIEILP
jgi:hypothetical protein